MKLIPIKEYWITHVYCPECGLEMFGRIIITSKGVIISTYKCKKKHTLLVEFVNKSVTTL